MGAFRFEIIDLSSIPVGDQFEFVLDGCAAMLRIRTPGNILLNGVPIQDAMSSDNATNTINVDFPICPGPNGRPINYNQKLTFRANGATVGGITIVYYDEALPDPMAKPKE